MMIMNNDDIYIYIYIYMPLGLIKSSTFFDLDHDMQSA